MTADRAGRAIAIGLEAVTDDEITTASLQAAVHDAGPIELAARPENRH